MVTMDQKYIYMYIPCYISPYVKKMYDHQLKGIHGHSQGSLSHNWKAKAWISVFLTSRSSSWEQAGMYCSISNSVCERPSASQLVCLGGTWRKTGHQRVHPPVCSCIQFEVSRKWPTSAQRTPISLNGVVVQLVLDPYAITANLPCSVASCGASQWGMNGCSMSAEHWLSELTEDLLMLS